MIREKRSLAEQALYEVLTDPIWAVEFLRTYNGFPLDPNARTTGKPFVTRWYQRSLLTDTYPYISICGARSIGKCHPQHTRIYTADHGYISIRRLLEIYGDEQPFRIYAPNDQGEWDIRIARIYRMPTERPYRITLQNGTVMQCTGNHPVYTNRGWVYAAELTEQDAVAVAAYLPWHQQHSVFTKEQMLYLGYALRNETTSPASSFFITDYKEYEEFRSCVEALGGRVRTIRAGVYTVDVRKYRDHPISKLISVTHSYRPSVNVAFNEFPEALRLAPNDMVYWLLSRYLRPLFDGTYITFTDRYIEQRKYVLHVVELLLRFGFATIVAEKGQNLVRLQVLNPELFAAWLYDPTAVEHVYSGPQFTFVPITSVQQIRKTVPVFAIEVFGPQVYLAENVLVHNSTVIQDVVVDLVLNAQRRFGDSTSFLVITPNRNQMVPLLDGVRSILLQSPITRDLITNINLSNGTLDFRCGSTTYRGYFRIAGQGGENNVVGLHVGTVIIDEAQLFPLDAWTHLQPVLNTWDRKYRMIVAGVPNGIRESVLYVVDQRDTAWKRYRIPATENPYWSYDDHQRALAMYGGENDDTFRRIVYGEHGETTHSVIRYEHIRREAYPFYVLSLTADRMYLPVLTPSPGKEVDFTVLAADCGFTDPTLIHLCGFHNGVWYVLARWRLTRVPFPRQADIITELVAAYRPSAVGIDLGAGGGGIGLSHMLTHPDNPLSSFFQRHLYGVQFASPSETVHLGGREQNVRVNAKEAATEELVRMIHEGHLVFSQLDHEGISQVTRIAYQRRPNGSTKYFVMSDKGDVSSDDHIYASLLVFIMTISSMTSTTTKQKLMSPVWIS